jgi:hypothetical protein
MNTRRIYNVLKAGNNHVAWRDGRAKKVFSLLHRIIIPRLIKEDAAAKA